jgi:uncharacterized protein (TIGR03083 family)
MQLNHESFEDLIGAYALDACDEKEIAALDEYVAAHPDARVEVERLRAAAAWLGASGPLVPPSPLRATLLARAGDGAGAVQPATGVEAYDDIASNLAEALAAVPADSVEKTTHNGLTVRELVAHLDAIDRVFLEQLLPDPPPRPFPNAAAVDVITDEALADAAGTPFPDIVARWRSTQGRLRDAALAGADREVMGYGVDDALVIRAFETWTHLDDVRRVTDRPGYVPPAPVLRSMADLSMRVLPFALAATDRQHPGEAVRVVLTGPGGREWDVPLAAGEPVVGEPATVMRADILDWCARFADRLDPGEFRVEVTGRRELVDDLVAAAPAFSSL